MSYILISKELFENPLYKIISPEAKLLYGFLADRSKLSEKNGKAWITQNNECFVYFPQKEVMERFGCSHDKASKLMRELENAKLVSKFRQGLCKPHMIVVKELPQGAIKQQHEMRDNSTVVCEKIAENNTYTNNTEINNPEITFFRSRKMVERQFKENICYNILSAETDRNILDSIIEIVIETLCSSAKTIRIAGQEQSMFDVQRQFMSLDDMHLRYVIDRIKAEENVIYSPKGYILRHLLYSDREMDVYYTSRVAHDEKTRRNG